MNSQLTLPKTVGKVCWRYFPSDLPTNGEELRNETGSLLVLGVNARMSR